MNAEIIAVGSELLLGQIVNTNARFLSQQLAEIGINVYYHTVVGDNPTRLEKALEVAEDRSNLIIFTGGLGPTKDDLTKETIARHLTRKLVMDEDALVSIKQYFEKTGREMTENNKKQALVLEGSEVLPNDNGMAPGMLLTRSGISYMLLPGPPKEMEPMFVTYGVPALYKKTNSKERIYSKVLRFFGIGEAALETKVVDLLDYQNPTVAPLASDGEVTLRITAKHSNHEEAMQLIEGVEQEILSRVGEFHYGYGTSSLINEVFRSLSSFELTIACAESLTGGMFQEEITTFPGSSSIFMGGIVSYSNEAKINLLDVKENTIADFGVISEQCAQEMAENVRLKLGANIGISFTGVAGPDEVEGKPVGTVWIGLAREGKPTVAYPLNLAGNRNSIRIRTVKHGCQILLNSLQE
ncbi:competence/damage-inducible protein A [Peribacillus alkalitolerans]|uniref:competence/damage-inducible protein A n=1 Tax=Peribacillus alkalitolerans TaxID=1550385 RepID=UPI0013D73270|nr:competence/damage-inducible protein A [Peribacillus alkalitolerans]